MTRHFSRWLGKTDLSIDALCRTVEEMERGLIDANLGGGIVKKRVALPGRGKRGSTRTLVGRFHGTYPPNINEGTHLISVKGPTQFQVVPFVF